MNLEKRKKIRDFLCNPHLLLCVGIAWMITNGWAYVVLGLGTVVGSGILIGIATAYLTVTWFPLTPEKAVTLAIAAFLLRWLYPEDEKTLKVIREFWKKQKEKSKTRRD